MDGEGTDQMNGWNTSFLSEWPIFRGELLVSGRVNDQKMDLFLCLENRWHRPRRDGPVRTPRFARRKGNVKAKWSDMAVLGTW